MDRLVIDTFFALLRAHVLGGEPLSDEQRSAISDNADALLALSRHHDMTHLIGFSLFEAGLSEIYSKFENHHILALFRYESIAYEQVRVCQVLEDAKIPHMPLKGTLLRALYPEPWMRPSCDVDVLVGESDLDRAVDVLCQNGYSVRDRTSHDVGLFSTGHIPTELHFRLWENGQSDAIRTLLDSAFETATLAEGSQYRYEMSDELFYFYHVAHMAKHVEHGGCGIRPFLDLWLMDKDTENAGRRNALLEDGDLLRFTEVARRLCRVWFEGQPNDSTSEGLETFILCGGTYGNEDNRVAILQQQRGGRLRYAFSRIFVPLDDLKVHFPILNQHPWLAPVLHVFRWFRILFRGDAGRSIEELNRNQNVSQKTADRMKRLLDDLGLPRA